MIMIHLFDLDKIATPIPGFGHESIFVPMKIRLAPAEPLSEQNDGYDANARLRRHFALREKIKPGAPATAAR